MASHADRAPSKLRMDVLNYVLGREGVTEYMVALALTKARETVRWHLRNLKNDKLIIYFGNYNKTLPGLYCRPGTKQPVAKRKAVAQYKPNDDFNGCNTRPAVQIGMRYDDTVMPRAFFGGVR